MRDIFGVEWTPHKFAIILELQLDRFCRELSYNSAVTVCSWVVWADQIILLDLV